MKIPKLKTPSWVPPIVQDYFSTIVDPLGITTGKAEEKLANLDPNRKGYEESRKAKKDAAKKQEEAAGLYDDLVAPEAAEEYALPSTLEYDGDFEAEQLTGDYTTGDSKFGDISIDPRYAQAQKTSLNSLQNIVDSQGLTAEDEANLARIQSRAGAADRGRREAIQDRMRRQGMAGSGLDMLAQLQSNQAATDRQSQAGLDVAAMGQRRKDAAIRDLGGMSTSMRGQAFGEEAQKAQAQDAIDRFNAGQRQSTDMFNVGAQNQAGMFNQNRSDEQARINWGAKEDTRRANTDIRNQNKRDAFNDDVTIRDKKSNAKLGHANYQQGRADRADRAIGQVWQGIGQGAGTAAQAYMASDEDLKKDVQPLSDSDLEQFLDAVKPKKYRYKDKKEGAGDRVGFMAQDIENTPIGAAVVQTDAEGTKRIDDFNLMGALLDSVSMLHKKQKKLEDDLPETESKPIMILGSD